MLHVDFNQLSEHNLVAFGDVTLTLEDKSLFLRLDGLPCPGVHLRLEALLALANMCGTGTGGPEEFDGRPNLQESLVVSRLLSDFDALVAETASD